MNWWNMALILSISKPPVSLFLTSRHRWAQGLDSGHRFSPKQSHAIGVLLWAFALQLYFPYCVKQKSGVNTHRNRDKPTGVLGWSCVHAHTHSGRSLGMPTGHFCVPFSFGVPRAGQQNQTHSHWAPDLHHGLSHSVVLNLPFEVI